MLLVDATNAFNNLNRQSALTNISSLCPPTGTLLINMYRAPSDLFIDGDIILSLEGTTQGDPLAMPMYAIATILLIRKFTIGHLEKAVSDFSGHMSHDSHSFSVIFPSKIFDHHF